MQHCCAYCPSLRVTLVYLQRAYLCNVCCRIIKLTAWFVVNRNATAAKASNRPIRRTVEVVWTLPRRRIAEASIPGIET